MEREIIKIDNDLCDGCALCIPNCHEGALQIIDEKAVLVSDLMCDGLGACIGHCPQGALTIEKREAEAYDEVAVMKEMIQKGNITTNIPTYYFTQLLALALGLDSENCHFELNDPISVKLLKSKKCLAAA